ncbi:MAG: PP2C family protein-serine/threonine phosphatase [Actinomycetota bacterium]
MAQQRLRVLLVEDDPGDAELISYALRQSLNPSFVVIHETTLATAIERLTVSASFDVLLLDLSLPDSGSADTLPRLQAAAPPLPIVIMTGLDDPRVAEKAIEMGAQDYLVKGEAGSETVARTLQYAIYRFRSERERLALADTLAAEYDRMAEELSLARSMQFDLLPRADRLERYRQTHGIDIRGHFQPCSDIGGDLWGCFEGTEGRLAAFLMDFSGHGVGAALNVFRLHTLISEQNGHIADPAATLGHLNRTLKGVLPRGQYATIVLALIDPVAGTLTWSAAGAPPPMLFVPGCEVELIDTSGLPLGIAAATEYTNRVLPFPAGSSLFLYSDAMTESKLVGGDDMVGEALLAEFVKFAHQDDGGIDVDGLVSRFLDKVVKPLDDDLTAVCITRTGAAGGDDDLIG